MAKVIAAIYARKSTDQNVSDEEKSVARQVERARAFAERKGWSVAEEYIYVDDGISGAEFVKRPAYLKLMTALGPRAPFQALVVMEQSRLGRSLDEVPYVLKRLADAGVRVYCYLTESEFKRETLTDRFLVGAMAFVDDMHREQSRQRTRDAMRRKAERGHVAGGLVYGHDNAAVDVGGQRSHVERRINPAEALVVRRLFSEIATGRGYTRIAKDLTAEGVPAPRRHRGWAASGVREMIFRDLYRGRVVYGKTRWEDRNGTKVKVDALESDWIKLERSELRIVEDALWQAAHARLDRTRATYLRATKGRLGGRPESEIEARYLLTGFLECATCHGGMHATRRTSQRGTPALYYVCREHRVRGPHICVNSWSAPMGELNADLVEKVRREVLDPALAEAVLDRAIALEQAPEQPSRRRELERELARLERELARFTEAIAQGGSLPSLLAELQRREGRRAEIQAQLEHAQSVALVAQAFDRKAVRRELRELVTDWQGLLEGEPAQGRQILRKVLEGRVLMTPHREAEGRFYEWSAPTTYGRILAGVVGVTAMVPPGEFGGFCRAFSGIVKAA